MNLTDTLALVLLSGPATAVLPGPLAAPTSPSTAHYGGIPGSVRVNWSNGDVTAYTRIYADGDPSPTFTAQPGDTTLMTQLTASVGHGFELRHYKNGLESAGVTTTWTP